MGQMGQQVWMGHVGHVSMGQQIWIRGVPSGYKGIYTHGSMGQWVMVQMGQQVWMGHVGHVSMGQQSWIRGVFKWV